MCRRCPVPKWNTTSYEAPPYVHILNGVSGKDRSPAAAYANFQKFYLQDYANFTAIFVGDLFKK